MYTNVLLLKKHVMLFSSLLNMEKNCPSCIYFCVYSVFHWNDVIGGHIGGFYKEGEFQTFCTLYQVITIYCLYIYIYIYILFVYMYIYCLIYIYILIHIYIYITCKFLFQAIPLLPIPGRATTKTPSLDSSIIALVCICSLILNGN